MIIRVDPIGLTALILLAILLGFVIDDHIDKPAPTTQHPRVTETPMKPPDVKWDSNFQWDQDSVWRDQIETK